MIRFQLSNLRHGHTPSLMVEVYYSHFPDLRTPHLIREGVERGHSDFKLRHHVLDAFL